MSDFNMGGLSAMLGGFKQRMVEQQAKAAAIRAEGSSGGGLVTVTATGDGQIAAIQIKEDALEDRELLEDLVRAASNEALRNAREAAAATMAELTAGLPIPPGLIPGL